MPIILTAFRNDRQKLDHQIRSSSTVVLRQSRLVVLSLYVTIVSVCVQLLIEVLATPDGHDLYSHLWWLRQYRDAFDQGVYYLRWLPETFGGIGAPIFYFYPPAAYFFAEVLMFLGIRDPMTLFKVIGILAGIASVVSAIPLLRSFHLDKYAVLLGALMYGFGPYRYLAFWLRGAMSEHFALIFPPLVLWGVLLIQRDRKTTLGFLITAVSFGLLACSSVSVTTLVALVLPLFALYVLPHSLRSIFLTVSALLTGLGLSAFYTLPSGALAKYIQADHLNHMNGVFRSYTLVEVFRGQNLSVNVFNMLLIVGAAIVAMTLAKKYWRTEKNIQTRWLMACLGSFLVLQIPIPYIAEMLWMTPPLKFLGFPFRAGMLLTIGLAAALSTPFSRLSRSVLGVFISWEGITAITGLVLASGFTINPHHNRTIGSYEVAEYAPALANLRGDDFVLHMTTSRIEPVVKLVNGDGQEQIKVVFESAQLIRADVRLVHDNTIVFRRMDWPYWQLIANGKRLDMQQTSDGLLSASLPQGNYSINLELNPAPIEKTGVMITCGSLGICIVVFGANFLGKRKLKNWDKQL